MRAEGAGGEPVSLAAPAVPDVKDGHEGASPCLPPTIAARPVPRLKITSSILAAILPLRSCDLTVTVWVLLAIPLRTRWLGTNSVRRPP